MDGLGEGDTMEMEGHKEQGIGGWRIGGPAF